MKGTDVEDHPTAPGREPAPATVELVGFQPTLNAEGEIEPSAADAAALAAHRRQRRLFLIWTLAILVVAIIFVPRVYRQAKTDRASAMARAAATEAEKGQLEEAVATVRSAYLMAPNDPQVVRAMAQILSGLNAPASMTYWNWVLSSSTARAEDRRQAAEAALKLGYYNRAGAIVKQLLHEDDRNAANLLMAARYYGLGGATSRALGFAELSVKSDPNYKPAVIFLAIQELDNPDLRQSGIDSLLKVAHEGDAYGFLAIQRLAQISDLTPQENQATLDALNAYGGENETRKIVELTLQMKLHPSQRDSLLQQAVAGHANASDDDLAQFGGWLNSVGESKWIFAMIPKEKLLKSKDLFLVYLDAMAAGRQWDDMDALMTKNHPPLETAYVELYLYRCSEELDDPESADLHWRGAEIAASHSGRESLYIADYAAKLGEYDRAEPIYRRLTHDMMAGRPAYLGLIRIYQSRDTAKLRDLLDEMTGRWPDDEAVANDDIYYNLLLNTKVSEMNARALALARTDPYSAPHLANVALAALRLHNPAQALRVFTDSHIQWENASAMTRVVYAATLQANHHSDEASRALASVNRATLPPEEKALIKDIR